MSTLSFNLRDHIDHLTAALRHHWQFFRRYFKSRRQMGSLIPSSRALSRATVDAAHVDRAPVVIELGPGTGAFTRRILATMRPDARLLSFEIMPEFVEILRERFTDPRLIVVHRSAEELREELDARGINSVQSIVCALPLNSMPADLNRAILQAAYDRLSDDGVMSIIQQTPFQFNLIRSIFPRMAVHRYVVANIPPSFVLVCKK